jgi:pilus assembly protein Flp/PilA
MQRLTAILREFVEADDGVTAMEYALLAGLIAVVIVVAVTGVGTSVNTLFTFVAGEVSNAATTAGL